MRTGNTKVPTLALELSLARVAGENWEHQGADPGTGAESCESSR